MVDDEFISTNGWDSTLAFLRDDSPQHQLETWSACEVMYNCMLLRSATCARLMDILASFYMFGSGLTERSGLVRTNGYRFLQSGKQVRSGGVRRQFWFEAACPLL